MTDIILTNPPKSDCAYAYESLRSDILTGRIQPHERIIESSYAEKLGISRTPVREALRLLERDGLVDFQPKRGAMARERLTECELQEVFRLRTLLQMDSVKETVNNITRGELSAMAGCNAACASAIDDGDLDGFFRYHDRFNNLLMGSSKMPFLIKLLEYLENFVPIASEIRAEVSRMQASDGTVPEEVWRECRRALREHMAIWDALNSRNVGEYAKLQKQHADNCSNSYRAAFRTIEEEYGL